MHVPGDYSGLSKLWEHELHSCPLLVLIVLAVVTHVQLVLSFSCRFHTRLKLMMLQLALESSRMHASFSCGLPSPIQTCANKIGARATQLNPMAGMVVLSKTSHKIKSSSSDWFCFKLELFSTSKSLTNFKA